MQQKIPLFFNGAPTGSIGISHDKTRYILCAEAPDTISGLARAYVYMSSKPEAELCVGVMVPEEGGVLRAYKSCTRNDIISCGVDFDKIDRGEIRLFKTFLNNESREEWRVASCPEKIIDDVVMQNSVKSATVLVEQAAHPRRLAVELSPEKPFALAPAFCLAPPDYINQVLYGVVDLNNTGRPILPTHS